MEAPDVGHEFALLNRLVPLKVLAPTRVHIRNSGMVRYNPYGRPGGARGTGRFNPVVRTAHSDVAQRRCPPAALRRLGGETPAA